MEDHQVPSYVAVTGAATRSLDASVPARDPTHPLEISVSRSRDNRARNGKVQEPHSFRKHIIQQPSSLSRCVLKDRSVEKTSEKEGLG